MVGHPEVGAWGAVPT